MTRQVKEITICNHVQVYLFVGVHGHLSIGWTVMHI